MAVTPLPGVGARNLVEALHEMAVAVGNVRGAGGTALDQFNRYQVWADETARRLSAMIRPADLDRLVTTRRHWTLQSIDPASRSASALAGFIGLELDERVRDFEQAHRQLAAEVTRWDSRRGVFVIADTNVYLHHDRYFNDVPWGAVIGASAEGVHLLVPLLVVDELDRHKRSPRNAKVSATNPEDVRTRARLTLITFEELFPGPMMIAMLQPDRSPEAGPVTAELLLEDPRHVRLPDPDNELVDQAVALQDVCDRQVHLVTFDTGMRVRARAAGLDAVKLLES